MNSSKATKINRCYPLLLCCLNFFFFFTNFAFTNFSATTKKLSHHAYKNIKSSINL